MRRLVLAAILVTVSSSTARADGQLFGYERRVLFSAPMVLGYDDQAGSFIYGVRPEVIVALSGCCAPDQLGRALGLGLYAEVDRVAGDTVLGAGLTAMRYSRHLAFGPSLGVYRRDDEDGVSASLFVGLRFPEFEHVDLPIGIRVEGRFGGDAMMTDRTTLVVTAQVDVLVAAGFLALVIADLGATPRD
jgi:hypothetical protein